MHKIWNILRMRKSRLLVVTYHLRLKLKLTLAILFDKESLSMISLIWSGGSFQKCILVCKLRTAL